MRSVYTTVKLRDRGSDRFWVRPETCDEDVIDPRYGVKRFCVPGRPLRADSVVVDVGAHIGAFAVATGRALPNGRVHAIEPGRETFELLARNVRANELRNVCVHRLAIADRGGTAVLKRGGDSWADSLHGEPCRGSEGVTTVTLERFLTRHRISRVDHLKMNVEGSEYTILLNTPRRVLRGIERMLVEYHPSPEHGGRELADWLRSCGFRVGCTPDAVEPAKGWLAATR
jgi:FkbM family methyltransferase